MAITLKLDQEQLQALVNEGALLSQEVRALSKTVEQGFDALIAFLGGADDATILEAAARIREQRERLQNSVENQPKETN